jgi:hypothetical protein
LTAPPVKKAIGMEIITGDKKTFDKSSAPEPKEYHEESFDFDSYSVAGWFKWVTPEEK